MSETLQRKISTLVVASAFPKKPPDKYSQQAKGINEFQN